MREKGKVVERKPAAIIYIRMSTQYQVQMDSNSAEMQRDACKRICEQNSLHVSKVIEQVKSGKLYRKDLFNVINDEMRAGDCIVVYSITRFARKQVHAHNLIELLKKKKCRLISATEDIDTVKDDKMFGLYAWLAEMESKEISARVKSSIEAKKGRLEHVGGMPYGYKYSSGKGSPLEINEKEMEIVDRMRKMRNEDKMSFLKIARTINVEGIPSPKKQIIGGWSEMTVKRIIERDDSKILTKAKRSWYNDQHQQTGSSSNDETEEYYISEDENEDDEPYKEEVSDEEHVETIYSPIQIQTTIPNTDLSSKPIVVLKAMILKKKDLFGFTADDLKDLSREDLLEILN